MVCFIVFVGVVLFMRLFVLKVLNGLLVNGGGVRIF